VMNVPYVSQIYMIHRGRMLRPDCGPTAESSECVLMREDDIPWDAIAFPTIYHSLKFWLDDRARGTTGVVHTLDLTVRPKRPEKAEVPGGLV
jgi:hypothetical protein